MTEDFLHYLWKFKLFNLKRLTTNFNENVEIISAGTHNHESGPDFFNAKIKLGDVLWVGNVEIHVRSSDWYWHQHEKDPAYANTILHVVYENDKEVKNSGHRTIPTIELKGRVSQKLIHNYQSLQLSKHALVCQGYTSNLNAFKTSQWLTRLVFARLERKVDEIKVIHKKNVGNWAQTFFVMLAKNLGFKTNALPMQLLAEHIKFTILLKNRKNLSRLESILLGAAGLLPSNPNSAYPQNLVTEFSHQNALYQFDVMESSMWKFGRIRPSSFPTIRIMQLAQIIHLYGDLFQEFIVKFDLDKDWSILKVSASKFWNTHYVFERTSAMKTKSLGDSSINSILINTIVPMLFFYGAETASEQYKEYAVNLLEKIPAEKNSITTLWRENNIFAKQAAHSQALNELTNNFCKQKNCIHCGIGIQILEG